MGFIYVQKQVQVVAFQIQTIEVNPKGVSYGGKILYLDGGAEIWSETVGQGDDAVAGDYVIFQSSGDRYRCPKDVFNAKYQLLAEVSA
ncbi:hypothetical protein [Aliamphritea ceti]|uniref:hypothetical protein n=1 Tax=Aliamphritea ceti TaxID=1524258 RepID=UPI0021C2E797|nr:hypothetical protein [Aliamphritea ceti]